MKAIGKTPVSWGLRTPIGLFAQMVLVLVAAYVAALAIADNDSTKLLLLGAVPVAIALVVAVLNDWRRGFYAFVVWILFEDIIRKYLGNNMAIYFFKDVLAIVLYVSFFRPKAEKIEKFRPPFRIPLAVFFWLSLIQVFNFASPSLLFGILGMKINFLYVPMLYIGYAFAKAESGFGNIVVELGILGLVCWLVLGSAITFSAWKVVKHLRGTPLFPLAFSIFLYVVLIFFPMTYIGMPYQDFLLNAYLWLLAGILFRLYHLKQSPMKLQPAATGQEYRGHAARASWPNGGSP